MRTIQQLVSAEVHYCVSHLVATLAGDAYNIPQGEVEKLCSQAAELAAPIPDYEEAAREAGWKTADLTPSMLVREFTDRVEAETANSWQDACDLADIEPYDRDVFEHWIVSEWLADKLEAKGEKVDRDFAGMTIWARTTSGQSIEIDSVIKAIHADLVRQYGTEG